jgi:hypothetical protein
MLAVLAVYTYRQTLGSSKGLSGKPVENGEIFAAALAQLAGHQLDNHMSFVVKRYGKETAFYWSDDTLIECSRLVAGDCHPDIPTLGLIWEKPQEGKKA